jgi:hypothetical protein
MAATRAASSVRIAASQPLLLEVAIDVLQRLRIHQLLERQFQRSVDAGGGLQASDRIVDGDLALLNDE